MAQGRFNHLLELEAESISLIREVAGELPHAAILFSGGKDSIVLSELCIRAFFPSPCPFSLLHIDTGHNFPETIQFRDEFVKRNKFKLIVGQVEDSIRSGSAVEETGRYATRNRLQSITLMEVIERERFEALLGGARRDEDKARAKERFFSLRNEFGAWDPSNQRLEFFNHFNTIKKTSEHFRVFPLSNWTELDVWAYIELRGIRLPSLYFSHEREVFERGGVMYANNPFLPPDQNEMLVKKRVRFRTIGDMTCTGALESSAKDAKEVIEELKAIRVTERNTRADDQFSESAMEDRKNQGYF